MMSPRVVNWRWQCSLGSEVGMTIENGSSGQSCSRDELDYVY